MIPSMWPRDIGLHSDSRRSDVIRSIIFPVFQWNAIVRDLNLV